MPFEYATYSITCNFSASSNRATILIHNIIWLFLIYKYWNIYALRDYSLVFWNPRGNEYKSLDLEICAKTW